MVEQVEAVQEKATGLVNKAAELTHKTFLLTLGVAGMTQDYLQKGWETGNEFTDKLIERGEKIYKESRLTWLL